MDSIRNAPGEGSTWKRVGNSRRSGARRRAALRKKPGGEPHRSPCRGWPDPCITRRGPALCRAHLLRQNHRVYEAAGLAAIAGLCMIRPALIRVMVAEIIGAATRREISDVIGIKPALRTSMRKSHPRHRHAQGEDQNHSWKKAR